MKLERKGLRLYSIIVFMRINRTSIPSLSSVQVVIHEHGVTDEITQMPSIHSFPALKLLQNLDDCLVLFIGKAAVTGQTV